MENTESSAPLMKNVYQNVGPKQPNLFNRGRNLYAKASQKLTEVKTTSFSISVAEIVITLVLAVLFIAVAAQGINTGHECGEEKEKMVQVLSHLLAIGLAVPVVLIVLKLAGSRHGFVALMVSVLMIIGAGVAFSLNKDCENGTDSGKKYDIAMLVISSVGIIASIAVIVMSGPKKMSNGME